jgi:hypothetical protein
LRHHPELLNVFLSHKGKIAKFAGLDNLLMPQKDKNGPQV